MSKINAVRLINLNYNNNSIRVSDEIFHMNGESTLLSLRNGGGKSVLVQMMMAPFLHKRYRDTKDRPFDSYFLTNKPTFIMVEWMLDQGAGYVMTGMMVRKSQEVVEEQAEQRESLEMVHFISEYKEPCMQDICHLPVVEKTKKETVLKGFGVCRQLFDSYKKDRAVTFFYFDANNAAQARQYFEKLQEYRIYYKEWETIIKKVNLKESGLSDLFSDCRDEKGLVEKWLLDAVESKLNKEKNRMKEFQTIIEKYVSQYKDNKTKIERRDTIRRFTSEAEHILEEAKVYEEVSEGVQTYENQIANFIEVLEELCRQEEAACLSVRQELQEIAEKRERLEYERISKEYYESKEQEYFHISNRDMICAEKEALESECLRIEERLHLLLCAKQQEEADADEREYLKAKQRLAVSRQKEETLEPERRAIGYTLKVYYEGQFAKWDEKRTKNEAACLNTEEKRKKEKRQADEMQQCIMEKAAEIAGRKVRIETYDEKEERFNRRYKEELARNILGEYEAGTLVLCRELFTKTLEDMERERMAAGKKLEISAEERKRLSRNQEDIRQEAQEQKLHLMELLREKALYDEELVQRRVIMKYFDVAETHLFDTDKIMGAASCKMQELERIRRELEQEEDRQQADYIRLTQGKVLELPQEFEAMLRNMDLNYVYGMEWLQKNGHTQESNEALVDSHPLLPYALILSRQELLRLLAYLEKEQTMVYTSFPIPMIIREELEEKRGKEEGLVISFPGVQFYVYFNQNLLDQEKLNQMILEKEGQIAKLKENIDRKKAEYTDYFEKQEKIRNQSVGQGKYEENEENLTRARQQAEQIDKQMCSLEEEGNRLQVRIEQLRNEVQRLGLTIKEAAEKLAEFQKLCEGYDDYLEEMKELERCRKDYARQKEQQRLHTEYAEKLQNELQTLEHEGRDIAGRVRELREKKSLYASFEKTECIEGNSRELEARYQAMVARMSANRQELEERAAECAKRAEKSRGDVNYLKEKYHLRQESFAGICYNRKEEQHQEILLSDRQNKRKTKEFQWNEEDKKAAVLRQQAAEQRKKMREQCHQDEPLAKEEIVTGDFQAKLELLSYQETEKRKQEQERVQKINAYEGNLTSLAEYMQLEKKTDYLWDTDFSEMGRKEMDIFRGMLIRDYRQEIERKQEHKTRLEQLLNRMLRIEVFREDFYRKPLESMIELTADAGQVINQLQTTKQSYENLIQKLEVDISVIEKEKAKIVELLEDYLKEVHENMGKIDHNSTITIRDRPVKMLKIKLPDWFQNEAVYKVRLLDFIDDITNKGIEIFEANENAQEYFGTKITSRNLYDTVIGIQNVQIRLYKIEAMREYPISWTEVAKNSGGEGFLSAFVILTSLLYYMRREDSDIFADRNEGKVLVMDNPFAQTNASHLLKPLVDMAKKTNTQLICLTGLGGESIYNRFDNIYVLNLIAASLRSGTQYLKTEQIKGVEAETVIASQIEVVQQQLIF